MLKVGSLDLENNILKEFDVVGASIHSLFSLPKNEQTSISNLETNTLFFKIPFQYPLALSFIFFS